MGRIGQRLRSAREGLGLSVRDISDQIRVRVVLLESLEAGRRDELPADVFVRGFVKSYARAVSIDVDEMKADLEKAFGAPLTTAVAPAASVTPESRIQSIPTLKANKPHPYTVQNQLRGRIAFAVILAVIVAVIAVTQYMGSETESVKVAPTPKPAQTQASGGGIEPLPADVVPPPAAAPAEEGALGEGAADAAASPDKAAPGTAVSGTATDKPADTAAAGSPAAPSAASAQPAGQMAGQTAGQAPAAEKKPEAEANTPSAASAVNATAPVAAPVPPPARTEAPKKPEEPKKNDLKPRAPVVAGFGARSVSVKAKGESWIIIYQDHKVIYNRLMRAGEELEYRFEGAAELTAGNPAEVEVTVDGQPAPAFRKRSSPSRIKLQTP